MKNINLPAHTHQKTLQGKSALHSVGTSSARCEGGGIETLGMKKLCAPDAVRSWESRVDHSFEECFDQMETGNL